MIQIFLKMKEQYIKTEMEYPLNFWLMLLSGVVTRFFGMLVPFIICSNIKTIAGWKQEEIYLIMSFLYLSEGLCSVLFEGIWQLPSMVSTEISTPSCPALFRLFTRCCAAAWGFMGSAWSCSDSSA